METERVMTREEYSDILAKLKANAEQTGVYEIYWLVRLMTEAGLLLTEASKVNRNDMWSGTIHMISKEGKVEVQLQASLKKDFVESIFNKDTRRAASTFWLFDGIYADQLGVKLVRLLRELNVRKEIQNVYAFRRAYLHWNGGDVLRKKGGMSMEEKIRRLLDNKEFQQRVAEGELWAVIGMAMGFLADYPEVYDLLNKIGAAGSNWNAELLSRGVI